MPTNDSDLQQLRTAVTHNKQNSQQFNGALGLAICLQWDLAAKTLNAFINATR